MTHLSPDEFADLIENALPAARAAHATSCDACRTRANDVRAALAATRAVEADEPSPLFWEHFSSRVREAIAAAAAPRRRWMWVGSPAFVRGAAIAAVALVLGGIFLRAPSPPAPAADTATANAASSDDWPGFGEDDGAWDLIVSVAGSLTWDEVDAVGFAVRPSSIDRAVQTLSVEERTTLARLLQEEMSDPLM